MLTLAVDRRHLWTSLAFRGLNDYFRWLHSVDLPQFQEKRRLQSRRATRAATYWRRQPDQMSCGTGGWLLFNGGSRCWCLVLRPLNSRSERGANLCACDICTWRIVAAVPAFLEKSSDLAKCQAVPSQHMDQGDLAQGRARTLICLGPKDFDRILVILSWPPATKFARCCETRRAQTTYALWGGWRIFARLWLLHTSLGNHMPHVLRFIGFCACNSSKGCKYQCFWLWGYKAM